MTATQNPKSIDPTKPTQPPQPTNSSESTASIEPTALTASTEPTAPTAPTALTTPTPSTASLELTAPLEPTTLIAPIASTELTVLPAPTAPIAPTALTEPADLRESATSIEPTPLTEPTASIAPTEPTAPLELLGPSACISPDVLAAMLAQAPPSAGPLDTLPHARLSAAGQLDAVVAWEHLVRHAHAGLMTALGVLTRGAGSSGWLAESEVCAALAWSPATAQNRIGEAHALTHLFPDTLAQLAEGRVSVEQARSLAQLTSGLDESIACAVQARVLPRMAGQSVAVTRQAIRRAVLRADPEAAAMRHRRERERRRVELRAEDDGMATLSFYLPADVAQMAMRTLTELAHRAKRNSKVKSGSDRRTLDQRRADLLPAVLHSAATGGAFGAGSGPLVPARVNVVVGIQTLLGLSHEPGHLDGYGPICPEQTRRIAHAHTAQWRFLLTATDGTVVDASARTYTPRAAVKRLTELKYTTCAFPHCAMPAERCDLDHNKAHHKGGPTAVANLAPLCRRHHNGKSHGEWNLNRNGDTIHWTSNRTGHSYTTTETRYQPTPTTSAIAANTTPPAATTRASATNAANSAIVTGSTAAHTRTAATNPTAVAASS